jgi:predicted nucleic-acid-binding protein
MISIDTNVLLRYLLADDAKQFTKANKLIAGNCPILITDVTLLEMVWTLMGKRYGHNKDSICAVIRMLFNDGSFVFEDNQVIWSSLRDYEGSKRVRGKELDFTNTLIANKSHYVAKIKGTTLLGFYSFDKAVEQMSGGKSP